MEPWLAEARVRASRAEPAPPRQISGSSCRDATATLGHGTEGCNRASQRQVTGSVESWLVSAGRDRRPGSPLNVPPIPASNFVLGEHRAYSRDDGTPGWEALEEIVGGLEGGSSVAFASGMAGIAAIFDQLPAGAVVALPDDCYQGVAGLANAGQRRGRWTVHRVAVADTAALDRGVRRGRLDLAGVAFEPAADGG